MKTRNQYTTSISNVLLNIVLLLLLLFTACKKQDEWLDIKRQKSDVVPSSLKDLQAILDNTNVMNKNYAQMGLIGADNNYLTDANLSAATQYERNAYLWEKDIFQGATSYDWQYCYQMVEYANVVLDGLAKININVNNEANYNGIKGSALFYRSMAFYELTQTFCTPYNVSTAAIDQGISIRLTSDVNLPSVRASVEKSYTQMITDLKSAVDLLPTTPLYTTRPSSVAANALLAKIYLSMEDYPNARNYADQTLRIFNTLLNFNSSAVSTALTYRFPTFKTGNPEIIFYAEGSGTPTVWSYASGTGYADPALYASYGRNDLRKNLFYQDYGSGKIKFQGNYTGGPYNFTGIATNEIYLIRAECYARDGNATAAMTDLNTLLMKRYDEPFVGLEASTPDDALVLVLEERRKELPYTGQLRWEDLRRLNKDIRFAKTLIRTYNNTTYTLSPNNKRYVLPVPDLEMQLYGLLQNER